MRATLGWGRAYPLSLPLVDTHQLGLPGEADLAPVRKSRTAARNRPAHSHIAQLTAALRQAEAERDAKDAFLSHLIHDLRTPLSAVVGMADLLKESQLSPDQREMMRVIRGSAEHLVGMMT